MWQLFQRSIAPWWPLFRKKNNFRTVPLSQKGSAWFEQGLCLYLDEGRQFFRNPFRGLHHQTGCSSGASSFTCGLTEVKAGGEEGSLPDQGRDKAGQLRRNIWLPTEEEYLTDYLRQISAWFSEAHIWLVYWGRKLSGLLRQIIIWLTETNIWLVYWGRCLAGLLRETKADIYPENLVRYMAGLLRQIYIKH